MVSQYNISDPDKRYGVKNLGAVVGKRIRMQGFVVSDANMGPKYAPDHQKNVAKWISEGTFKAQQSITVGIDNAIKGFLGMLKGDNFGKSVLTIEDMNVSSDFESRQIGGKANSLSENGASAIEKRTHSAFCTEETPNASFCDLKVLGI